MAALSPTPIVLSDRASMGAADASIEVEKQLLKLDARERRWTLADVGLQDAAPGPRAVAEQVHPDVEAAVYRNVLLPAECERLVDALNQREDWRDKCSKKHVRYSEGLGLPSRELADLLWARLDLPNSLPAAWRERVVRREDRHLGDVGTEGTWAPVRVNDVIRCSRYRSGGHFSPHRDGVLQPRVGERSFLTVLVYLTSAGEDSFSGGETAFVREDEALEYGAFDVERDVLTRVVPEAGNALVFLQDQLHAGLPVTSGPASAGAASGDDDDPARKYIMITEVFYERVARPEDGESWAPESVALLREAEAHEARGEFAEAIKCYSRLRRVDPEFALHAGVP